MSPTYPGSRRASYRGGARCACARPEPHRAVRAGRGQVRQLRCSRGCDRRTLVGGRRAGHVRARLPRALETLLPSLARDVRHEQLAMLLACTRLVAMDCPWMHSVFRTLSLRFPIGRPAGRAGSASLRWAVRDRDERFRLLRMSVEGAGGDGVITAHLRPAPRVQPSYEPRGLSAITRAGSTRTASFKRLCKGKGFVRVVELDATQPDAERRVSPTSPTSLTLRPRPSRRAPLRTASPCRRSSASASSTSPRQDSVSTQRPRRPASELQLWSARRIPDRGSWRHACLAFRPIGQTVFWSSIWKTRHLVSPATCGG